MWGGGGGPLSWLQGAIGRHPDCCSTTLRCTRIKETKHLWWVASSWWPCSWSKLHQTQLLPIVLLGIKKTPVWNYAFFSPRLTAVNLLNVFQQAAMHTPCSRLHHFGFMIVNTTWCVTCTHAMHFNCAIPALLHHNTMISATETYVRLYFILLRQFKLQKSQKTMWESDFYVCVADDMV